MPLEAIMKWVQSETCKKRGNFDSCVLLNFCVAYNVMLWNTKISGQCSCCVSVPG